MKKYLSVPEKVKPGTPWRIFIKAEDKDGDMKNIVASDNRLGIILSDYLTKYVKELTSSRE